MTKLLIELVIFGSLLLSFLTYRRLRSSKSPNRTLPRPPVVEGSLPILGHWWQFSRDPVEFLRAAYKRHGPIFQVNLFFNKVIYVCDRELQEEFYNATDEKLSLAGVLDDMKLDLIFMERLAEYWPTINQVVRRSIALSYPKYGPIIKEGAEQAMHQLEKTRDLEMELSRYVVTTPPKCLFNVPSTESLYNDFIRFKAVFKMIIFSSYIVPTWIINNRVRFLARSAINSRKMGTQFLPEIDKYFEDPTYDTSTLVRLLVDQEFPGGKLSVTDIKNLILLFAHKNSENTINLLRNVLLDLAENPEWMAKAREECAQYVDGFKIKDTKGLLQSKLLQACCMESARLNANVVVSKRKVLPHSTLGGYFIGHTHEVVPCATFFMIESEYYKNSLQYNPNRYIADKEMHTCKYITTWGNGVHQCPGKVLVLNVVKMFVALVITNYDIELKSSSHAKDNKSYFTLTPFIVRTLDAELTKLNNN